MKFQQWEYAVFTVRVPYGDIMRHAGYVPPNAWPDEISQAALLEEMNKLGLEGWEIWMRTHPTLPPAVADGVYPFNLWARRPKQ